MTIPNVQREIEAIESLITEAAGLLVIIESLTRSGQRPNTVPLPVGQLEYHILRLSHHVSPLRKGPAKWHGYWIQWHMNMLQSNIDICHHRLERVV